MKLIKFTCFFITCCLVTIIMGELHYEAIISMANPYFAFQIDNRAGNFTSTYITNTALTQAKRNNVGLFAVKTAVLDDSLRKTTVYMTKEIKPELLKSGVREGFSATLLQTPIFIEFETFENLDLYQVNTDIYVSGDVNDALNFEKSMLKIFPGKHSRESSLYQRKTARRYLYLCIAFMCVINPLISLYDVLIRRKEVLVRLTLGADLNMYALKNTMLDAAIYAGLFLLTRFIFSFVTLTRLYDTQLLAALIFIIMANAAFYLSMYFIEIKQAFSKIEINLQMLIPCYIIKTALYTLTLVLSAIALHRSVKFYDYLSEHDYFKSFDAYSHIIFRFREEKAVDIKQIIMGPPITNDKFYRHFGALFDAAVLHVTNFEDNIMYANPNSGDILNERIAGFKDFKSDAAIIFILPGKVSGDELSFLKHNVSSEFSLDDTFSYDIFYYEQKLRLPSFGGGSNSEYFVSKNPQIIYINYFPKENDSIINYTFSSMNGHPHYAYKLDKELFYEYAKTERLYTYYDISFQDIYRKYASELSKARSEMLFCMVVVCLLFVVNCVIGAFSIKVQYRAKAAQIAVMKILGYTLPQRHTAVFAVSAAVFAIIFPVFNYVSGIVIGLPISHTLVLYGLYLLFELFFIICYAARFERMSVLKTLKGGKL